MIRKLTASPEKSPSRKPRDPQLPTNALKNEREEARQALIRGGCNSEELDLMVEWVRLCRNSQVSFLPSRHEDLFRLSRREMISIRGRIRKLSRDLRGMWTDAGTEFVERCFKQTRILWMPDHLERLDIDLQILSRMVNRTPMTLSHVKSRLVKYVREATKSAGRSWHDAELAALCNEDRRAWAKWRQMHYQPVETRETDDSLSTEIEFPPPTR